MKVVEVVEEREKAQREEGSKSPSGKKLSRGNQL
jgi:hypothetical protein